MTKRPRSLEEYGREIEAVLREIENTQTQIDKVVKEIVTQEEEESALKPRVSELYEELCDLQSQLSNLALSNEAKAGLLEVKEQRATLLQHLRGELDAARKKEGQLRKKEEQLRKKEEQLRDEKLLLCRKEEGLRADLRAGQARLTTGSQLLQQQLDALPTPLDMAFSKDWSRVMANTTFFKCFRPKVDFGVLPVALYDPVLDQVAALFAAARKGVGGGGGDDGSSGGGGAGSVLPLSHGDYEIASRLCEEMPKTYANEAARVAAFSALLKGYLGERIDAHRPISGLGYETDGSLLCQAGGPAALLWLPICIVQGKLEVGTQGDPFFQGQRYHQLYVTNPELAPLVRDTVLPVLFVELVGPHLRVSALASPADATVVCEPLTPYLHLFTMHRHQPDHMICVALVLRALKSGIELLKESCSQLQQQQPITASPAAAGSASTSAASAPASVAGPASAPSSSAASAGGGNAAVAGPHPAVPLRDPSLQLPYPLRPGKGFTDVQRIGAGAYNPLYFAVYEGRPVAVKFAHMSTEAISVHRAWAAEHLAPEVVLWRRLPCGLVMLVVEQLAPADGWVMFRSLPADQKEQLNGAVVEALHKAHAIVVDGDRCLTGVHADLRQANVMVRLPRADTAAGSGGGGRRAAGSGDMAVGISTDSSDGGGEGAAGGVGVSSSSSESQVQVRFVDFDWSGLQGHTRLPAFSCMRIAGYGRGCEVTREYDDALWEYERENGPL